MVARPLFYLLFAVLAAAAAYWTVVISIGGLRPDPFRRSAVPEVWPMPPSAAAHPFWTQFPSLSSADRGAQRTAWLGLFNHESGGALPHPAAKPADWPRERRVFAHALLWRLYRARSFRAGGLELRLEREDGAPLPRVGDPSRLQLRVAATSGSGRARFPRRVRKLLDAGGRLYWFTSPLDGLPWEFPRSSPPVEEEKDEGPAAVHRPFALHAPSLAGLPFETRGRMTVRVVLDLTHAEIADRRVPRGLWVTNPLVLHVESSE